MTKILSQKLIDTKKITDVLITLLIFVGAFLVPTFLAKIIPLGGYQQLVVGTIVNVSLIITAIYTKGTIKTILIATLPSMSTILSGLLFATMTKYTQTMIPAIWLGNFAFILLYKTLFLSKKINYPVTAIVAILVKVAIIYLGFTLMTNLMTVPEMVKNTLNTSMGVTQLITATSGSILAFLIMLSTKVFKGKE